MIIDPPIISLDKIVPSALELAPELIYGCFLCGPEKVIARSTNFSLRLDNSPIVGGHLMLGSDTHIGCSGEIDPLLHEEYLMMKDLAGKIVEKAYGAAGFFEHGRAGHCATIANSDMKCDHFHLHILPIKISVNEELEKTFLPMSLAKYSDIFQFFERYGSYLYFEDHEGHMNIYPASDDQVESHLIRTLICKKIGHPERSNWEDYKNPELVNDAIKHYRPIINRIAA